MDALREKYSGDRDTLRAEYNAALNTTKSEQAAKVDAVLGKGLPNPVIMCQACQAHGTVKVQYGYRVMDEQCKVCNGEGMIIQKPKVASEELQEKVARVEALILEVEDLEDLERYEAALKERTIQALDAVLEPPPTTGQ